MLEFSPLTNDGTDWPIMALAYRGKIHLTTAWLGALTDALGALPLTAHLRAITEVGPNQHIRHWLFIRGVTHQALSSFLELGFGSIDEGAEKVWDRLSEFAAPGSAPRVVKVKAYGPVTEPGMIQDLVRWVADHHQSALVILDVCLSRACGLATLELTFVLDANGVPSIQIFDQFRECMLAEVTCLSRARASRHLRRLFDRGPWRRPRLPACLGNAADLFPM